MRIRPQALTTGEAAALMHVSQQTVIGLCNGGLLKSWKVPGSKHRRIPRPALLRFMEVNGIPLPEGEEAPAA